jgi:hypothetical protein
VNTHPLSSRSLSLVAVTLLAAALTGCAGMAPSAANAGNPVSSGKSLQGQVYGGQQPVSGAQIAMYAAVTTGYGVQATSLLASPGYVLTDASGDFGLTGAYDCPTNTDNSSAMVYVVATGGNPGNGMNNGALRMMTALGSCAQLKANAATTYITINEVTTIASVYALSGFMSSPTQVSSSGTTEGILGLTNAFAGTALLANTSNGFANTTNTVLTATAPQAKVNSLANALAACLNSDGSTASGHPCGTLFAATTVGGVVPTDTLQAAINIAHNPSQSVAAIFNVQSSTAPFAPSLAAAPNDWTLGLTYKGGGISAPQAVAIDASGAVVIANKTNSVTYIIGNGFYPFGSTGLQSSGFDAPSSISINTDGSTWVANCGNSCSNSGKAASLSTFTFQLFGTTTPTQYTGSGLSATYTVGNDGAGNVWAGNTFGNSVTELSSAGAAKSGTTGYAAGGFSYPVALALDASGNAWVANPPANSVVKLTGSGVAQSGTAGFTGGGLNYPYAIAIDASGNAWVANHQASSVVVLNASGAAQSGAAGYTGAGLNLPIAIAFDGAGKAWLANSNNSVSALTSTGAAYSGTTGFTAGLNHVNGVAVDNAGNVWLTSCGSACTGGTADAGSVVELIGAAVPVVTPIAQAAKANMLATRP